MALTKIDTPEIIDIIGLFVNIGFGFYISYTLQNGLNNRRVLKDHFINEIKDLRNEYKACLNNIYQGKTHPKSIAPWFKLMNIKVIDLMRVLSKKYRIVEGILSPYQKTLIGIITDCPEFEQQYKNHDKLNLSEKTKIKILKFQQDYSSIFNELIVTINDH